MPTNTRAPAQVAAPAGHAAAPAELAHLLEQFAQHDPGVDLWRNYPANIGDTDPPDCSDMSYRFAEFCTQRSVPARTVFVRPPDPEPWYDDHWFVVVGDIAVDWTARQFYNCADDTGNWLNPDDIACPLLFEWPGTYPVPHTRLVEADPLDYYRQLGQAPSPPCEFYDPTAFQGSAPRKPDQD